MSPRDRMLLAIALWIDRMLGIALWICCAIFLYILIGYLAAINF